MPLVAGVKGEGALRPKLRQRVEDILVQGLARRPWCGWATREELERQPDVLDNWRIRPWECKNAARLAIKRLLDGAARAHFRGEKHIPMCPCGVGVDEQEHWPLLCHGVATVREEWWGKMQSKMLLKMQMKTPRKIQRSMPRKMQRKNREEKPEERTEENAEEHRRS